MRLVAKSDLCNNGCAQALMDMLKRSSAMCVWAVTGTKKSFLHHLSSKVSSPPILAPFLRAILQFGPTPLVVRRCSSLPSWFVGDLDFA